MLIEGTKVLPMPRAQVWEALNDPAFLQSVIPGCRRVAEPTPGQLRMELTAAVGPIKANFEVEARKVDVVAPQSFVLEGRGSAGVAGSATGRARLLLTEVEGGTQLDYSAETEITGRVAQLGARMIDSTARKFSEEFFANVGRALSPGSTPTATPAEATAHVPAREPVANARTQGNSHAVPMPVPSPDALSGALARLVVDGLAWRLALGCAAGSFTGLLAAAALLRGWA